MESGIHEKQEGKVIINKISSVAKLLIPGVAALKPVAKGGGAGFPRKSARFRVITGFSWWLRPWKAVSAPFTLPPLSIFSYNSARL